LTRALQLALRAEALRLLCESGTTHCAFAARVGITKSQLSVWLSPRANPTIASWSRIFGALGCDVEVRAVVRKARAA
jgi:DNA-binding phage protein